VFNGTRWRTEIQPRIREMIRTVNYKRMIGGDETRIPPPVSKLKAETEADGLRVDAEGMRVN
jgi:poly(3-hydroxybutyrate) depolymerase